MTDREIWDRKDVAQLLGCSTQHVINLANDQGLPHMRLGKLWRFRREDVLAWVAAQNKVATNGKVA